MAKIKFFDKYIEALHEGKHNFASHTLKVMLTSKKPASTDSEKGDITQITSTGYTADGYVVSVLASYQQNGQYTLAVSDLKAVASGGDIGPARYAVLYNDSAINNHLVGYYDAGSEFTIEVGTALRLNFDSALIKASYAA